MLVPKLTFMYRSGLYRYFVCTESDCTDSMYRNWMYRKKMYRKRKYRNCPVPKATYPAEIGPVVWGTPDNFNGFRVFGSVTARQSSSERKTNFAALNRGRHLCSAGRPSRWALAHILANLAMIHAANNSKLNNAMKQHLAHVSLWAYTSVHNQSISQFICS